MSLNFSSLEIEVDGEVFHLDKGETNFDPGSDDCEDEKSYWLEKPLPPTAKFREFLSQATLPFSCNIVVHLKSYGCEALRQEMRLTRFAVSEQNAVTLYLQWILPKKKK